MIQEPKNISPSCKMLWFVSNKAWDEAFELLLKPRNTSTVPQKKYLKKQLQLKLQYPGQSSRLCSGYFEWVSLWKQKLSTSTSRSSYFKTITKDKCRLASCRKSHHTVARVLTFFYSDIHTTQTRILYPVNYRNCPRSFVHLTPSDVGTQKSRCQSEKIAVDPYLWWGG